jgi:hypothetical protein
MKAILFIVFFSSSNGGTSQAIEFKSLAQCEAVKADVSKMAGLSFSVFAQNLYVSAKCVEVPNE